MLLFNRVVSSMLQISMNFNTSNVTIQHGRKLYFCGFNCNFNTSNVTIQPAIYQWLEKQGLNFNTSNVTIQQYKKVKEI